MDFNSSGLTVQLRIPSVSRCCSSRLFGTQGLSIPLSCGRKTGVSRLCSVWVTRELSHLLCLALIEPITLPYIFLDSCFIFPLLLIHSLYIETYVPDENRTGFGQHADYVFGWEGDSLKRAMDVCTGATGIPGDCPVLTQQSTTEMNACRQAVKVDEEVEGICAYFRSFFTPFSDWLITNLPLPSFLVSRIESIRMRCRPR
jgi:hypothetical protein